MDITKLEALSSLSLPKEHTDKMQKSLDSIVSMLHSIDSVNLENSNPNYNQITVLADDVVKTDYLIEKSDNSLHSVDGLFLAPKVIHK